MVTFLVTTIIVMLALGLVAFVSSKRSNVETNRTSALSLLPGDIKYESPGGGFTFYFPITTSIVVSIVLSLVLYLLR